MEPAFDEVREDNVTEVEFGQEPDRQFELLSRIDELEEQNRRLKSQSRELRRSFAVLHAIRAIIGSFL